LNPRHQAAGRLSYAGDWVTERKLMPQLDILVHVRNGDGDSLAAQAALALAKRMPCHLYGLYVAPMGAVAFSTPETVVFQVHEADHLYGEALARRDWWQSLLAGAGAGGEWLAAQGEPVEALCHAARWSDLVVAERPLLNPDAPTGWGTVSRTVFGAGVPVIVVPQTAKVATLGARVLVAWNHSREAMRAIRGALPLLQGADQISVLDGAANEDRFGARHLPQIDLPAYFTRHGVKADFRRFAPRADFGAGILGAAREMQADTIVMGAWGQSRIAELVLGGATRYLFQNSDLPLFVAH
jgi:nucleotide-binding universal stress UspA family protein